jgi:hypothetical protein
VADRRAKLEVWKDVEFEVEPSLEDLAQKRRERIRLSEEKVKEERRKGAKITRR